MTDDEKESCKDPYAGRASRKFWAVTEHGVEYVTGYECSGNPGLWWCPEVGYTMEEGRGLFDTEVDATLVAVKETHEEYARIQEKLGRLKKSLHMLREMRTKIEKGRQT